MIFILKYWKYIGVVFAVLSVIGAFFSYRGALISKGVKQGLYQCEIQKKEVIDDRIDIRKDQDGVIRDNTTHAYINSLRKGNL